MALKIIIEGSSTPIYRRIINSLAHSLGKKHHQTTTIEPDTASPREFVRRINELKPDLVVISNLFGLLSSYHSGEQKYAYEMLSSRIVFLHYDNVLGPINDWDEIERRLKTLVGMSGRCMHFCIEANNCSDLEKLSIQCVHGINHATEFDLLDSRGRYRFDVSFVGHVLPESIFLDSIDGDNPLDERVLAAYKKRRQRLDYRIEEDAVSFADLSVPCRQPIIDWLTAKQVYRARINGSSLCLRGRIISAVADYFDVDVIGGDPSYINNRISTRQLEHARVHLHIPNRNHQGTDRIYAESRININITSIQFDSAIVNRVLDVAAAGGFLLTDWKDGLSDITSVCESISYRSIDELNNKIDYYLTHDAERLEIAAQLHHDVMLTRTYDHAMAILLGVVAG